MMQFWICFSGYLVDVSIISNLQLGICTNRRCCVTDWPSIFSLSCQTKEKTKFKLQLFAPVARKLPVAACCCRILHNQPPLAQPQPTNHQQQPPLARPTTTTNPIPQVVAMVKQGKKIMRGGLVTIRKSRPQTLVTPPSPGRQYRSFDQFKYAPNHPFGQCFKFSHSLEPNPDPFEMHPGPIGNRVLCLKIKYIDRDINSLAL